MGDFSITSIPMFELRIGQTRPPNQPATQPTSQKDKGGLMNIFSYLYQPPITASVVAVILSIGLVALVWMNKGTIAKVSAEIRRKTCNRNGFFWVGYVIFMSVSVLQGGGVFWIAGNPHVIARV